MSAAQRVLLAGARVVGWALALALVLGVAAGAWTAHRMLQFQDREVSRKIDERVAKVRACRRGADGAMLSWDWCEDQVRRVETAAGLSAH